MHSILTNPAMIQSDYQRFQGFCDGVLMSDDTKSCAAEAAAEGQQMDLNL